MRPRTALNQRPLACTKRGRRSIAAATVPPCCGRGVCPHARIWIEIAAEDSRLYTEPVVQTERIRQFTKIGVGCFSKKEPQFRLFTR